MSAKAHPRKVHACLQDPRTTNYRNRKVLFDALWRAYTGYCDYVVEIDKSNAANEALEWRN